MEPSTTGLLWPAALINANYTGHRLRAAGAAAAITPSDAAPALVRRAAASGPARVETTAPVGALDGEGGYHAPSPQHWLP